MSSLSVADGTRRSVSPACERLHRANGSYSENSPPQTTHYSPHPPSPPPRRAASEARYVHDMLRKMIRVPCFLDSSALNDLRKLITEGVHQSDALLLLATKSVLSRPWCLIELLEATRQDIPIVIVQMANGGFGYEDAHSFVINLEDEMTLVNSVGLDLIHKMLGTDLADLKQACHDALDSNEVRPLIFNAHDSDNAMIAAVSFQHLAVSDQR